MQRPTYRWLDILFLFLGGIFDPFQGLFTKIVSLIWVPSLPKRGDSPARRRRGLTIVLGGIEGRSYYNASMVRGILCSAYRGCVVRLDWNQGSLFTRSLINLMSSRHHDREAGHVAEYICNYNKNHPDAPICIVAQSGGAWIAIRALELLPENVNVHKTVLLAAAVSPGYDVSAAAARCSMGLISVGGAGDFFFLGLGTLLLGTGDRVHAPSVGLVGWRNPPAGLVELRWRREWLRYGYVGNHTSSSAARFVAKVVAPLLA